MAKGLHSTKLVVVALLAISLAAFSRLCSAADDTSTAEPSAGANAGLYVKVQLNHKLKMSKLKPGELVEGRLSRDVYSAHGKLFSAGSDVRLTVDHMEKRKRLPNDHWPGIVQVFTPRKESYPVFKSATIVQDDNESPIQVSLISAGRLREIRPKVKKNESGQQPAEHAAVALSKAHEKNPMPTMVLEALADETASAAPDKQAESLDDSNTAGPETLPAGTRCKILLLTNVSASKSNPGDPVQARLLEPVLLNSKVIVPAGSLFDGKVTKKTPPRRLSRAGSLRMEFTGLTLPGGNRVPIAASLAGAELNDKSHTRMDAEGRLHGERPGKAWMAINLGVTVGLSKVADDGAQLVIEALVSAATDASTAGMARIVSSCVSGVYLATRHGRDVVLPRFTEIDISLDRALSLNAPEKVGPSSATAGGN